MAACVLALTLLVVGRLAHTSGRGELLFLDGDSQIVRLIVRSILGGEPLDWMMSPVLFVPESALYAIVSAVGLDMHGTALLSAIVNVVLLYVCLRFVSGRGLGSVAGVTGAGAAFALYAVGMLLEGDGNRDALELSSLLITTTYYSGTIFGVLLLVGMAARAVSSERNGRVLLVATFVVSAVSSLSNPLFVAWGTLPVSVIVGWIAWTAERRRPALVFAAVSIAGAGAGLLGRVPLASLVVADDALYVQPGRVGESIVYYASLVADRASTPVGALEVAGALALVVLALVATLRSRAAGRPASERLVLGFAWLAPLSATIGFVLLGTHAARYLQPWAFAPVLGLAILAAVRTVPPRRTVRVAGAVVLVATSVLAIVGGASLASSRTDPSLTCATDWVNAQDRSGAGPYWSIRAIKANIDRPGRLIQVDANMNGYGWLVNGHDFATRDVHFLITDARSPAEYVSVPPGTPAPTMVDCGRWQIADYGDAAIPVGPVHH